MATLTASTNGGGSAHEPETPDTPPDQPVQPVQPELASEQSLYQRFMELVPGVRSEMKTLAERREKLINEYHAQRDELSRAHKEQLAGVETEKRKLLSLLKALGEEEPRIAQKRGRTNARVTKGVSDRILLMVLEAIQNHTAEPFTTLGIHEAIEGPATEASVYAAFSHLRSIEFIGKAGEENRPNGRTLWIILPNATEIGERLHTALTNPDTTSRVKQPSLGVLRRTVDGITSLGSPFAVLELSEHLGQASPKNTYVTVRYLHTIGYLEEAGRTPDQRVNGGGRSRQLYKLANEHALDGILDREQVNA